MRSQRLLPALLLLFIGSGCAALIYEVVWFQLLELVIGSSAVSIGVLLGTFMGGMCLGSLLLPRLTRPDAHPLRTYAWLELGIGVVGLIVLFAVPLIGGAYTSWAGTGIANSTIKPMMPMPSSRYAYRRSGCASGPIIRGRSRLPRHMPPMNVPRRTPIDTADDPMTSSSSWNQTTS